MRFAFILGHVPVLSSIEAKKLISDLDISWIQGDILIGDSAGFDPKDVMRRSGGLVKIASFVFLTDSDDAAQGIASHAMTAISEGKITFGISSFGDMKLSDALAVRIKECLQNAGRSVRHVRGKEASLNSAELVFNDFHKSNHVEYCLIPQGSEIGVFVTEAFQDLREYVELERALGARDDRSGVLPLRLAKMLVNISGVKPQDSLLDPFCGSGILVSVAAALGVTNIVASDSSPKAVQDARNNLEALGKLRHQELPSFRLERSGTEKSHTVALRTYDGISRLLKASARDDVGDVWRVEQWDARMLSKHIAKESVDVIVTEPYLGPQTRVANEKELGQMNMLYHDAFKEFRKIVKPGGTVLFIFPMINSVNDFDEVQKSICGMGFKKVDLMEEVREWFPGEPEPVYFRPHQRVKRLIIVWRKE